MLPDRALALVPGSERVVLVALEGPQEMVQVGGADVDVAVRGAGHLLPEQHGLGVLPRRRLDLHHAPHAGS